MAKYINPVATGLAIGEGEAQVFDTSGIWEAKIKAKDDAKKEKEKKEKELLDSLVDIDTSNVWDRDLDMYNEKWNDYNNFIKDNYTALQNPSKNVDVYQQKRRKEQEMLQFVSSSGKMAKLDVEVQDMRLKDRTGELQDVDGLYAAWRKDAGNMSNPLEYIQRIKKIAPLTDLITKYKKSGGMKKDKDYTVPDGKGGSITQKGTSEEAYKTYMEQAYNQNEDIQNSNNKAWEEAGGAGGTAMTAEEFFMSEAMKQYDKPSYRETQKSGGLSWSFGAGGGGAYGDLTFSSAYQGRDETEVTKIVNGEEVKGIKAEGQRNLIFRKNGKNLGYQEMNLDMGDGTQQTIKVAMEDIVEVSEGKYKLRVRVPKVKKETKALVDAIDVEIGNLMLDKENAKSDDKAGIQFKIEAKQQEKRDLVSGEEVTDYEIRTVPLSATTNIDQVETTLGLTDFYKQIPNLLTKEGGGPAKKKFN